MGTRDKIEARLAQIRDRIFVEAREAGRTVEEHAAVILNKERSFRMKMVIGGAIGAFIAGFVAGKVL